MITDKSFDFGFSLVSENELREHENILRETIANETEKAKEFEQQAQETETELNERMNGLVGMIMPLLNNLSKDPSKEYIILARPCGENPRVYYCNKRVCE